MISSALDSLQVMSGAPQRRDILNGYREGLRKQDMTERVQYARSKVLNGLVGLGRADRGVDEASPAAGGTVGIDIIEDRKEG